ncbi:ABC transporter ATP-binding protein [Phaeocystidibacter luteus]|uniref:ABC transporter ATP-binding protein n=1 Tax=Phaeocystidibacter luteus TaxID=911197 RepID=A0A6N6RLX1_9FLAO|nr:ABC transporter ATP-binding protein [Phaeocystidibacter luteus]KAB2814604.1 ABC transporter ATP-binding protein [Phaeocystidibacter luteus]
MKSLAALNKYFLRYWWLLALGVLFVIASVLFQIYPAIAIREALDKINETVESAGSMSEADWDGVTSQLVNFGLLIIGSSLISGFFTFLMRQTIIVMSRHIEFDLKNDVYKHYQELSLAFYKRNSTGDLMNRISEDVSRVRMYIGPGVMYTVRTVLMTVIVITIMLGINVKLTLLTLAPLPVLVYVIYKVSDMINKRSLKVQAKLSDISTYVQETFSGIRVVKAYAQEKKQYEDFKVEADEYHRLNERLYRINALFMPVMLLLIGMSTVITVYVGGVQAIEGTITVGNIGEFVYYVFMLTWPVASIGWVTSIVQRAAASQERINEFWSTQPEIVNSNPEAAEYTGEIEFKDVSFVYPDSGIRALNKVNFKVKAGNTLAIVGKTGSGKSTIATLIGRLFDPTEGSVTVDGVDLKEINLDALRNQLGYVPQEGFLFSETIGNNIGFGLDNATQEDIEEAAKNAHVHHNIIDFPNGYETRVGERGITLSGGQKQRVSIARAIIKKPRILIFDDSLSAVDTETEDIILNSLAKMINRSTTVIIAHRISSVKHADQILVLDNGEVVESGSHTELMELEGAYKKMYDQQLQTEAEEQV